MPAETRVRVRQVEKSTQGRVGSAGLGFRDSFVSFPSPTVSCVIFPVNVPEEPALLRAVNSRQDYNVLFAEKDGARSSSQIMAFEDTWEWNLDTEKAYQEMVEGGGRVSDAMRAFRTFLGHSDMMAYLEANSAMA